MNYEDEIKKARLRSAPKPKETDLNDEIRNLKSRIINGKNTVVPCYKNALWYLIQNPELSPLFRYNEFCSYDEIAKMPPWGKLGEYPKRVDDYDLLGLKNYYLNTNNVEFQIPTLDEAVKTFGKIHSYDPVKDYLNSLTWDKEPRVEGWMNVYLGAPDDDYTRYISKLILAAACARVDRPGLKFDYLPILEGPQDLGKSLALEILGGQWYKSIPLLERTKETVEKMQGAWIIEVPELAVFKKKDIESLKAFITMSSDTERLPWFRRSMAFPRRNVFIGTINPDNSGYLTDTTGNRRFMPIVCTDIKLNELRRDRDQLWAEAWQICKSGMQMWLPKEISVLAKEEQTKREIIDEWMEPIAKYAEGKERLTSTQVWADALNGYNSDFDRFSQRRVAEVLYRLGWERRNIRLPDGTVAKGFTKLKDKSNLNKDGGELPDRIPWE